MRYKKRKSGYKKGKLYIMTAAVCSCSFGHGVWCASDVQIHYKAVIMKDTVQEQTILLISDLHTETAGSSYYDKIKRVAEGCDIVSLGGNLFDEATSLKDMELFM